VFGALSSDEMKGIGCRGGVRYRNSPVKSLEVLSGLENIALTSLSGKGDWTDFHAFWLREWFSVGDGGECGSEVSRDSEI
jgi:hypothetical protein